jgi:general nucleoside transport system permease protein
LHIGIIIALIMVIIVYFLLDKTIPGYTMKAVGSNPIAAMVAGINYKWIVLGGLSMSGALAGLAGAIEVSGVYHCLLGGLSPNYGVMSIILAAVGKNNPLGIVIASFFFAILFVGSDSLQRSIGLPASAVIAFQGVMFLFILAGRIILEGRSFSPVKGHFLPR